MRKPRVNSIVLDSAAVLAMIQGEPGGDRIEALLDAAELGVDVQVAISSVNWCEILTRMQRDNKGATPEELSAVLARVKVVPFDKDAAEIAASYALVSQSLSLGDRACLSLAKARGATAWTADRIWTRFKLDVPVELIRG
jgi:PIN domain nuclease of toxin-antitoxin system